MRTLLIAALVAACGSTPATSPGAKTNSAEKTPLDSPPNAPSAPADAKAVAGGSAPTVEDIWQRIATDATACYEAGRKKVPEMVDGHITFIDSVDASGKTMCVVPSDDSGLTQDVEDCMRLRLERETYAPTGKAWSSRVPIQVRGGKVSLGGPNPQTSIGEIESRGLSEDIYDIIEGLLPEMKECIRGNARTSGRRVVVVGVRVAKDGGVACAAASSTSAATPLPDESRGCLATVFSRARFKAPKGGVGLLSVPLEIR